jgi:hypothetical protein
MSLINWWALRVRYSFVATKIKKMKKVIVAAALLLAIGTTRASQTSGHSDERNILSSELPTALQANIKSGYAGYWITELAEAGEGKHVKYTLTLENADQVLHLRAGKDGQWEVVETVVKA